MQKRIGQMVMIGGLLASAAAPVAADAFTESKGPESPALLVVLGLVAVFQLVMYGKRRLPVHGALALLSAGFLGGWIVHENVWPLAAHFKAVLYAAIVPLVLIYIQTLHPRRWLRGMIDFTWAYALPYAVIVFVYPPEQLVPILPVMEKFSFLSLGATLIAADQARRERQPGALPLLLTLALLVIGLMLPGMRAYALGLFTTMQVGVVSLALRTRP